MDTNESSVITPQHITSIVENQNAMVLLYSIAGEYLYSWLVTPRNGRFESSEYKNNFDIISYISYILFFS